MITINKTYGFRISDGDEDIYEVLESMTGGKRSEYIKSAIRHYINYGAMLDKMASEIEELLNMARTGDINIEAPKASSEDSDGGPTEYRDKTSELDSIIADSIGDILFS